MKRETELVAKIVEHLKYKHNCIAINIAGSQFQMSGLPDFVVIKDKLHIWVECKIEDEPLKGNQFSIKKQFEKQGVHVYVLRFMDKHYWMIDEFYHIRFKVFKDAIAELLRVLTEIEEGKKLERSNIVSMVT